MASSITKLFSGGRRFNRFWDRLELSLHEACTLEVNRLEPCNQSTLYLALRDRFTLYPVELGRFEGITMKPATLNARTNDRSAQAVKAIARVRFSGSPVLLHLKPEADFRFPFKGQYTKHALLLHTLLPDFDGRGFVEEVDAELDRIRPLLEAFRSTVAEYDNRLRARIEAKIRTF